MAAILFLFGGLAHAAKSDLDRLFLQLKNASNETEARDYENRIWLTWFKSGDQTIDDWMQEAMQQRKSMDFRSAMETLNQVIERNPAYPEAWNQRAIVHFYQGNHEQSLEDIAKTLELEPRHFGAMAGRAVIRLQQGKPAIALQNVKQALEYHPYLPERALFPQLLPQ
jgi:tetratricopeptide (TPR) repeat protein